jgi:secreted trypsin-like serine protease
MKHGLITLSFLFFISCSDQKTSQFQSITQNQINPAIIGGIDVPLSNPISHFTVGLYDKKLGSICTGTLIQEDLILTAAHCIEGSASNLVIIFGLDFTALDANNLKSLRSASRVKVHSDFKKNNPSDLDWNDIAVVQFSGSLPEGYSPVEILNDLKLLKQKTPVLMAGFGASGVDLEEVSAKKDKKFKKDLESGDIVCYDKKFTQCYRITFLGSDRLRSTEASIEGFTEKEIRMNEAHGQGTCVGDSGGPLLYQNKDILTLIGVTSRGSQFCDGPAVYTNATEYLDWIEQSKKELK